MANLPKIDVYMNLCTRPAILTPKRDAPKAGLKKGEPVNVNVFGLYQVKVEEYDVDAYFVVELPNGRCVYASVESIQFTDKDGEACEPPIYCD